MTLPVIAFRLVTACGLLNVGMTIVFDLVVVWPVVVDVLLHALLMIISLMKLLLKRCT